MTDKFAAMSMDDDEFSLLVNQARAYSREYADWFNKGQVGGTGAEPKMPMELENLGLSVRKEDIRRYNDIMNAAKHADGPDHLMHPTTHNPVQGHGMIASDPNAPLLKYDHQI